MNFIECFRHDFTSKSNWVEVRVIRNGRWLDDGFGGIFACILNVATDLTKCMNIKISSDQF